MGLSGIDLNFNCLQDEGGKCLVRVGSGTGRFCFDDSELVPPSQDLGGPSGGY
jgi:hypothetical protein